MSTLHSSTYVGSGAQRTQRSLRWHARWTVAALLCIAPLAACGGDDDAAPEAQAAGTGGSAGASTAGSGGSAGATVVTPQPVACGSATCSPPSNQIASLLGSFGGGAIMGLPTPVGCCLDESAGKCGVSMSAGGTCEAPAVADNRCPGINAGALGGLAGNMSMAGCCINNACGQDGSLFGRGCVDNTEAKGMLSAIPLVGMLLMIPPARACDAPPTMTTDGDAGVDDAGI